MKSFLTLALVLIVIQSFGQDIITKKSGEDIECKVTKIDLDIVEYKKASNPDGPTYTIAKDNIFRIKYTNGEIELFNSEPEINNTTNKNSTSNSNYINLEPYTDPRDGKIYKIIQIHDQIWFAENLNYETEKSSFHKKEDPNGEIYGRFYFWEDALNVCPDGWHLPSDEEWLKLEMNIGMLEHDARKTGWRGTHPGQADKLLANGETGFNIILCYSCWGGLNHIAYFWTSTSYSKKMAYDRAFTRRQSIARSYLFKKNKSLRANVRCIKD